MSFAVVGWSDVFTRNEYKDILLESLSFRHAKKGMEIAAWCIMTNHVRLAFRCVGTEPPQQVLGDFKRYTGNQLVRAIKENPREGRR